MGRNLWYDEKNKEGANHVTLIQCFDPKRLENLAVCLRLQPQKLILLGDPGEMEDPIIQYEEVLALRKQNTAILPESITGLSVTQVAQLLMELAERETDPVLDLTGGEIRVVMAAGALLARGMAPAGLRVQRYDPETGTYVDCDGDGKTVPGRNIALSAQEMITLYGGTVHPKKPPFANHSPRALTPLWSVVRSAPKDWNRWMSRLAELESRAGFKMEIDLEVKKLHGKISKFSEKKEELDMILGKLKEAGVIEDSSTDDRICYRYTKPLYRYCTKKAGNALEVKTLLEARALQEDGRPYFDDCQMSVNIDWDGKVYKPEEKKAETRNEVDVILTRGTKTLFISCKNGHIEEEELYKLNTVAEEFGGPNARKMLIVTELDRGSKSANSSFDTRAWDMDVFLVPNADTLSRKQWAQVLKGAME